MNIIKRADRLPKDKQYVLAFLPDKPWFDSDAPDNEHKWVVVKFVKGLSMDEREKLPNTDKRKIEYTGADQEGNNLEPYCWHTFGPSSFFGQDVELWCELPTEEDRGMAQ